MYTNAQVATLVANIDRRLVAIEARIATLTAESVPTGAPATATASGPVVIPERGAKAERYACSLHPDHKGGKGFTANGRAAHATWCAGTWSVQS